MGHQLLCILGVAVGGALGGLARWKSLHALEQWGCSEMWGLMVINLTGCFMIGAIFLWLECSLCRDGTSRLKGVPFTRQLSNQKWWPEGDPTMPLVLSDRLHQKRQLLTALFLGGFCGSLTTFSGFSLVTMQLARGADWPVLAFHLFGSVILGYIAVWTGMLCVKPFVLRSPKTQ